MEPAPGTARPSPAPRTSHLPLRLRVLVGLALPLHPHSRDHGRRGLPCAHRLDLPLHTHGAASGARRLGFPLPISLPLDATRAAPRLGLALPAGRTTRFTLGPTRHRHYRPSRSAQAPGTLERAAGSQSGAELLWTPSALYESPSRTRHAARNFWEELRLQWPLSLCVRP